MLNVCYHHTTLKKFKRMLRRRARAAMKHKFVLSTKLNFLWLLIIYMRHKILNVFTILIIIYCYMKTRSVSCVHKSK